MSHPCDAGASKKGIFYKNGNIAGTAGASLLGKGMNMLEGVRESSIVEIETQKGII